MDALTLESSRAARMLRALLATVAVLAIAPAAEAQTPPVQIEVRGVDGDVRDNVLARLSIANKEQRRRATEGFLRHLHGRAEDEIRAALEPFGYYRPIIRSELVTDGRWIARYEIEPGPPIHLDSVHVAVIGEGAADPQFAKRVREFPLRKGEVLIHPSYERGKADLEGYAAEGGYLDARFVQSRIHVDLERYAASIALTLDSGPRHYFGPITYEQDVLDPGVLDHFADFRPGDIFDFRKLVELQTDLSETGWFSRVEVQRGPETAGHRDVPIIVTLSPARPLRLTAGAGYGTDDGARGRSLVELRRINREGHRARIEAQLAQIERSVGVQYQIPWLHPRSDMLTLTTGYQDLRTQTSGSGAYHAGVSLTRMLGLWQAGLSLHYRRESFTVGPDVGTVDFLVPEASWSRIRTDDRLVTWSGDRVRLSVRGAHDVLFSDVTFLQPRAEGKLVYGLGDRNRVLARVEGGYTSTTGFRRLPPSIRFFTGGANSVRGYSYNSLGPRDPQGRPVGGEHLLVASLEFEHRFLANWGAAVFYDVGNAVNSIHDRLSRGVGAGLRWASPMGWVRGDLGWGLDRPGTPIEIHISVGPEL
jgi:translocation and assembly module TamA